MGAAYHSQRGFSMQRKAVEPQRALLKDYVRAAATADGFRSWMDEHVLGRVPA